MFLNLPYASPGPFFQVRFVPRKCIIWLKQIIRQTLRRLSKASEPSEPREGGGRKKRKTVWILPCTVVAAGAKDGENRAGGWMDWPQFVCSHHCHLAASITVARKGNISGTQDSLLCPYPQFTSRPYCNCLHSSMVHSILVAAQFVWNAAAKTVSSPLPCQTLP